jgi:uncharacterized protein
MKLIISIVFIITFSNCFAQTLTQDRELLMNGEMNIKNSKRNVVFMKIGKNAITQYNPFSLLFSSSLYFYQKVISPQIMAGCAFEISCSAFSKKTIETYGVFKGIPLSADRILRCNKTSSKNTSALFLNDNAKIIDPVSFYKWRSEE